MSQREIYVTRVYDATPEEIWTAWTTDELIEHFFGPDWAPVRPGSASLDVRVGGEFALEMQDADDGTIYPMRAEFLEVDEPTRIVLRTQRGGEMIIEFEDLGEGKTQLRWIVRGEMDAEFYRGTTLGIHNCADKLGELLASRV